MSHPSVLSKPRLVTTINLISCPPISSPSHRVDAFPKLGFLITATSHKGFVWKIFGFEKLATHISVVQVLWPQKRVTLRGSGWLSPRPKKIRRTDLKLLEEVFSNLTKNQILVRDLEDSWRCSSIPVSPLWLDCNRDEYYILCCYILYFATWLLLPFYITFVKEKQCMCVKCYYNFQFSWETLWSIPMDIWL
jgi:hypothetical protein